jgi:hypothetical protein
MLNKSFSAKLQKSHKAIAVVRHLLQLFRLELQDPTRAANFVDSPNASSRSVMFLITSPKKECTLASQLMVHYLWTIF